jgi:hypothetical protein
MVTVRRFTSLPLLLSTPINESTNRQLLEKHVETTGKPKAQRQASMFMVKTRKSQASERGG